MLIDMKLIFEGRKDKINTLIRLNKNYASRNGIKLTLEVKKEPKKDVEDTSKGVDTTKRVRRTKAEIEAEKLKK